MDKSEKLQNIVREQRNEIRSLKYENEVKEDKNLELRSRIRNLLKQVNRNNWWCCF